MDDLKSLDSLFKEKIFRIPDYQRGYAWQKSQLKDFWEDLINLSNTRSHYTGVLTLKEVSSDEIDNTDNEYCVLLKRIRVESFQKREGYVRFFIFLWIDELR